MARRDLAQPDIDGNGIVAWNLRLARNLHNWTQSETVNRLTEYGISWSVPSLSNAELSWRPNAKYREFTAADLMAFSLTFNLPLAWWFLPPTRDDTGDITFGVTGGTILDRTQILNLMFGSSSAVKERLAALPTSPVFASTARLRITAHLEQQEHDLQKLLNDVVAAQEFLKAEGRGNSWTNEGDAQELLKVEGRSEYWTNEGDDDG